MNQAVKNETSTLTPVKWGHKLAAYREPDDRRAVFEIAITLIPFIASWFVIVALMKIHIALGFLAMIPAAGFLLRLFILQHDCGHDALFSSTRANNWVGRFLGLLTLTPYDYWRQAHAVHHATSGNLDRRGMGEIGTLTVEEYNALSKGGQFKYRFSRHPAVLFLIGPAWLFLLQQRFLIGGVNKGKRPWISVFGTNLGIAILSAGVIYYTGWKMFLMIEVPMIIMAGAVGIWLFYVQHQFEEAHWSRKPDWKHEDAALHGSSYYDLPWPLPWFSGNIGIHHVHHISSRIPFHRLPQILKDHPELKTIGRLTVWESLKCARLKLWDESAGRLVSFRQARQLTT